MLLEKTTGIYTGSIYTDNQLVAGGFVGERTAPRNGETLFQKAHVMRERRMPDPKGFLFMIRNPFDASIAEWKRQNGQSHSAVKSEKIFGGEKWNEAAKNMLKRWKVLAEEAIEIGKNGTLPFHFFFYEDLKANATKEMEKIVDFIEQEKVYFVSERDKRLRCLQKVNKS
jgi:hypothetical protein